MPKSKRGVVETLRFLARPPRNRTSFILDLPDGANVFDVGCGNDSPYQTKRLRPDLRYVGLDVGDYYQQHDPDQYADEYILVTPDEFLNAIVERSGQFDAVISAHNLEHCSDQDGVVSAMADALRPEGRIYLAFPAAATVRFPSRANSLNFYDDSTHTTPPDFRRVLELLAKGGVRIQFAAERYRPLVDAAIGLLSEPISRRKNRSMRGTWALYGFETVIWGFKTP